MATTPRPGSDRAQLASRLRTIRAATGMSGSGFARLLDWPQSRVSKLETGTQFPTEADLSAWLTAAGAAGELEAVSALLVRARIEAVSFRDESRTPDGPDSSQRSVRAEERSATTIAVFYPAMIPGLLQTAAYARELLGSTSGPRALGSASPQDIERMVATRIERQSLLYDTGKRVSFVLGEAALWTRTGSLATHRGQLDRLQSTAGLATLDIRIVPFDRAMPVFPLHGFTIYDDNLVRIETITNEFLISDPREIESYQDFFDALHGAALKPDETVQLIRAVSSRLADQAR